MGSRLCETGPLAGKLADGARFPCRRTACGRPRETFLWIRIRIYFFDTTLRDGEQSPGCSMTHHEKLALAHSLADLGVDILEAGFAIASDGDFAAITAMAAGGARSEDRLSCPGKARGCGARSESGGESSAAADPCIPGQLRYSFAVQAEDFAR